MAGKVNILADIIEPIVEENDWDAHIWIWWINQDKQLAAKHQAIIAKAKNVFVSSVSCWELVILYQRQRIELIGKLDDWLHGALAGANIVCLPIDYRNDSHTISPFGLDPADRFIVATAIVNDCYVMSSDEKFLLYPELATRLIGRDVYSVSVHDKN